MKVTEIEIHIRRLLDDGHSYGDAGQYEELRGTMTRYGQKLQMARSTETASVNWSTRLNP